MSALRDRLSTVLQWLRPPTGTNPAADGDGSARLDDRKMEWKSEQIDKDGHSRRDLLKYGVGAVGVAGAGWGAYTLFLDRRSPEKTVQQYYEALDEGDVETAESLIHEDSPVQELREPIPTLYEQNDVTVEEVETVEQGDGRATVRTVLSGASSQQDQQEIEVDLRTENGEWKLWLDP